jgi:hypothetical protein
MRTSVTQAFAENGDAFVLRGNPFEWAGKWPHLPAEEAARLIADVIDRYTQTMKRPPRRLVVHKQSRFFPEELAGFQDALDGYEYDLVALAPSTGVRLMRHGDYPPPRGACLNVGDRRYLYTTGYVPSLGRYPHGHVPTPVQITDHVGDSSAKALLAEVLLMTKMNWNSARVRPVRVVSDFAVQVDAVLAEQRLEHGLVLMEELADLEADAQLGLAGRMLGEYVDVARFPFQPACLDLVHRQAPPLAVRP